MGKRLVWRGVREELGRAKRQSWLGSRLAVQLQRDWKRRAVSSDTDLVIEGFPRSANSYATVAFLLAQQRSVRISHHIHSPFQIQRAQALGVPCLVLVRNPVDAVASLAVKNPWLTYKSALKEYHQFYDGLSESLVIGSFGEVTNDFSRTVKRLNQHYGKDFGVPPTSEVGFDQRVFEVIGVLNAMRGRTTVESELRISRPTKERRTLLEKHRARILSLSPREGGLDLSRALVEYRRLAG